MLSNRLVRRIDNCGRITFPLANLHSINLHEGDPVEIALQEDGVIIIRKYKKSFEQCAKDWYQNHTKLMDRCEFIHRGDHTFCIAPAIQNHSQHSRGGHAKRYMDDEYNTVVARVAAFANAMDKNLNEMIGYEG